MTVLICMAMVVLLHMVLAITDRGNREHWKYRGPWGRKQYWALMKTLDDRGIPGKQTLVEGFGTLGRVLLIGMTYWQVTAYTFAAWLGIRANPSTAGFWGACLLSAILIAFQSLIRPLRLVGAEASASNPGESTRQRLVLFAARLCAVPVVTMALAVLFADVNTMRTWLVRSVSGIGADSDKVLAELPDEVIAAAAAVLVLLVSAMAYAIVRMGNRLVVAGTPDVFRRQADENCYLYLRSFNDDNISMQSPLNDSGLRSLLWPRIGFEELLALLMNASVGRLITIGRPTERLPRVGAYRNYFNEDEWREGIRVTAERVRGIVLTVGATESLAWEVRHLKEWGLLRKCLFMVPPLPERQARARTERLLQCLEVNEEIRSQLDDIPMDTLLGLRVSDTGRVSWIVGAGREWFGYMIAPTVLQARTRDGIDDCMTIEEMQQTYGEDRRAFDTSEIEEGSSYRRYSPTVPPAAILSVMLRTLSVQWTAHRGHSTKALQALDGVLASFNRRFVAVDSPNQSMQLLYLLLMRVDLLKRINRLDLAAADLERMPELLDAVPRVWHPPLQAMDVEEAAYGILADLGRVRAAGGDPDFAYAASSTWLDVATDMDDVRQQTHANIDCAWYAGCAGYPETALNHAHTAMAQGHELADHMLEAQGAEQVGYALRALHPDMGDWELYLNYAAGLFDRVAEPERARHAREVVAGKA